VPQVRLSVPGPKKMGAAPRSDALCQGTALAGPYRPRLMRALAPEVPLIRGRQHLPLLAHFQINIQQRKRSRGHARNPARLA
jgi:hypothetical protein